MGIFEIEVSAMVTICESDYFTITANSAEEAEEKAKEMFKLRMWEKHGYADYSDAEVIHYCNDWEEQDDEIL